MEGGWEYSVKKVGPGADLQAALNEDAAWELVTITPNPSVAGELWLVLRRPVSRSEQAEKLLEAQREEAKREKPPTSW
ncbi:MAG TPA: hypothetical protein VK131_02310 [Candidatus Acidoferrales bacterium]|nr:hypothetical protein [Candidatus Acidoferrales bacterium]